MELIRHRGDHPQAQLLEQWLVDVLQTCGDRVLDLDGDAVQIWGRLRVPNPHNAIDKQIAAIALLHDLTVVTPNTDDFAGCGVRLLKARLLFFPGLPFASECVFRCRGVGVGVPGLHDRCFVRRGRF